jgi:hypothetical protein
MCSQGHTLELQTWQTTLHTDVEVIPVTPADLYTNWLVVLTILKNISQWEGLSHILWKIKHV